MVMMTIMTIMFMVSDDDDDDDDDLDAGIIMYTQRRMQNADAMNLLRQPISVLFRAGRVSQRIPASLGLVFLWRKRRGR